ncbi:MAG: hypothetical protein HC904_02930 [Blastochloris sp.]|nr:hypothetical protein [Blastochloris sp.]
MAPVFQELFTHESTSQQPAMSLESPPKARLKQLREILNLHPNQADTLPAFDRARASKFKSTPELEAAFTKHDALLKELEDALNRPLISWNLDYEKSFLLTMPHLGILLDLAKVYQLRALMRLEKNDSEGALQDLALQLRLATIAEQGSLMIGYLVATTIRQTHTNTAWEILHRQAWNSAQISKLGSLLNNQDPLNSLNMSLRWERAAFLDLTAQKSFNLMYDLIGIAQDSNEKVPLSVQMGIWVWKALPEGRLDSDRAHYVECMELIMGWKEAKELKPMSTRFNDRIKQTGFITQAVNIWTYKSIPAYSPILMRAAQIQANLGFVQTALAIERYRLATGRIPDSLDLLIPDYLPSLPQDPISGRPLFYNNRRDGSYLLYSIGWNEKDDGGEPNRDAKQGDWVWPSHPGILKLKESSKP